jgi:hypothetical protein
MGSRPRFVRSSIEVDTRDLSMPTLRLEVVISGKAKYQYVGPNSHSLLLIIHFCNSLEIVGSPVKPYSSMSLGTFVPGGLKSMLHNVGIKPKKWF